MLTCCLILLVLILNSAPASGQVQEIKSIQQSLKNTTDKKTLIDRYNRLAMLSQMRYRDSCYYYSAKALKIAQKEGYSKGIADALNCQGIYYLSLNNYLSAKYFNDALALYKQTGDLENQAQLLMNMSVLMFIDNNRTEAKKYIYSAFKKSMQSGKDSIRSIILSDILTIDTNLTKEKRDRLFQMGLATAEKYNDYPMMISYQNNLGTQLYNDGKETQGLEILEKSLQLAEREGSEYVKVSALMTLGEMELDLKNYKKGIAYYELGMANSEKFGYTERYLAFAERLYHFYKEKKDTENAFKYASLLLSKHNEYAQAVKESGYNYLSYVSQESLLKQKEKEYQQQKKLAALLGGLMLMLLLVVYFLWMTSRNRKKYLKLQQELHLASLEKNKELQVSDHFNTMLISILAHDIREPFANIEMLSQFFDQGQLTTPEEFKEVMSELNKITHQGISFMDGLLLWIKSKNQDFNLYKEFLNAQEILSISNAFFEKTQKEKAIAVVSSIPLDFRFFAPKQIALFIFRNLLNNATKYANTESTVAISAVEEEDRTIFKIRNSGKTMTNEALESLFDLKSETLPNSISGGAGVALKISYEMMQKIGGEIGVESTDNGETIFFVAFPLKK